MALYKAFMLNAIYVECHKWAIKAKSVIMLNVVAPKRDVNVIKPFSSLMTQRR
jgi:hypothetical protein